MSKILKVFLILSVVSVLCFAQKKPNSTTKNIVELTEKGAGKKVGTIKVTETANGIFIEVKASGLKANAGRVGFHLHEKNSPKPTKDAEGNLVIGGGLGGHWDPDDTQTHAGPNGNGHRGDLDALTINADGSINQTVVSSKIKYSDVKGKSFVIHANDDNYKNNPANGGSGARLYAAIF